ncbi:germination specific n-acetylmuramoyl-l-alanine amidase, putative [Heliomicrobium modesticaldum Ice1]|uniref:Germination specific n-acetylmuramoyl-l-alanine amidase, putative n=1 Tax=Heliobacterium modesticaldum (strain ATCC 51547 / Ice1) TaxID=498761 RepID=B0TEC1_HELMI|nr:N-acetylmuramoyl-L-alanine amidase [Heliomicrobium modesticaldum]ABZ85603.1 germination specific n-acetylmuramoyl-l-alanine amidase, putative [Heliomicrobium modesticaldum Ice1]
MTSFKGILESRLLLIRRRRLFLVIGIAALLIAIVCLYAHLHLPVLPPGPAPDKLPLEGKKILIDAGHGGIDSGTNTKEGYLEKTVNLEMSIILKPRLEALGAKVLLSRESDVDLSGLAPDHPQRYRTDLANRVRWANDEEGDLLLSLHINSARDPQMRGAILLYHPKTPFTDQSKELAHTLQKELNSFYAHYAKEGEIYRHQPYGGDFFVLEYVKMPSVIVEMGFITNYQDRALFLKADFRNALAQKIADGVVKYINQELVKKTFFEWLWPRRGHLRDDSPGESAADMVFAPGQPVPIAQDHDCL